MFSAPYHLRPMLVEDIDEVMAIERAAYPFPWSAGIFRDCIKADYYCLVLEERGAVIGYAVMMMAAGEAHLLNICIQPDFQGLGLGRALLRTLEGEAILKAQEVMLLEVRVSNCAAIGLYKSMGFSEIGRRKCYYPAQGGREDAVVMAHNLPDS